MEPLNSKERTIALLKYLVLALVVIILVVLIISIDTDLPAHQTALLKKENEQLKTNNKKSQDAIIQLDTLNNGLERYNSDLNKGLAKDLLTRNVGKLITTYQNDSSGFGIIMKKVGIAYSTSLQDKTKLLDNSFSSQDRAQLEKQIADLKDQVKSCKDDLRDCKNEKKN